MFKGSFLQEMELDRVISIFLQVHVFSFRSMATDNLVSIHSYNFFALMEKPNKTRGPRWP